MANRIMGITVEIGGDTTKLQTALKSVNSQIKSTQQQLKDVDKLLNGNSVVPNLRHGSKLKKVRQRQHRLWYTI